ncbi:hypothetical protein [Bradyrhizobium sp. USDA 4502]
MAFASPSAQVKAGDSKRSGDAETIGQSCIVTTVTTVTSNTNIQRAHTRAGAGFKTTDVTGDVVTDHSPRSAERDKNCSDGEQFFQGYDSAAENLRIAAAIEAGAELSVSDRAAAAEALLRAVVMPARHAERDALIVDCRRRYFAELADHAAAHEISRGLSRYAAGAWRRDRSAATPPATGRMGLYWMILRTAPPNPDTPSPSTIRRILAKLR